MEQEECALLVINPLNFKQLNMLHGYAYGDKVLVNLGNYLNERAHKNPGWRVFRLSDDRFLLLITGGFSHQRLAEIASTIIDESYSLGMMTHPPLVIGIAEKRNDLPYQGPLLKGALIALNSTRADNPIQFYNTDLEKRLVGANAIEQLLVRVIGGEEGLFSLCFQPIHECASGRIVAFEALARLKDLQLGEISPEEFIPIAERQQLITPLGMVIFPMALTLIKGLGQRGVTDLRVAINVSPLQLLDNTFIDFIKRSLNEHAIAPSSIELELTESAFADEQMGLTEQLRQLRTLGIRLSIDDFGSGYSSLNRLRSLQFDTLKLGWSFIQQVKGEEDTNFLSDIISMAHHIGKRVVAEGVETEEQRDLLQSIKCDLLQGYLLGRPLSLEEALALPFPGDCHD